MRIPADEEIRVLHRKHAPTPEALDSVYTHCVIVAEIAERLMAGNPDLEIDPELVRAGALLHDIGVYRLYAEAGTQDSRNYIRHGILGQELLAEEGLPYRLCRFASHHTGMGLTKDDVIRQRLPLPVDDYLAETAEEELVMYADKFHVKARPPVFLTGADCAARMSRFGAEKALAFDAMLVKYGEPDVASLAAAHGQRVAAAPVGG
jgi:uncharacterized protein